MSGAIRKDGRGPLLVSSPRLKERDESDFQDIADALDPFSVEIPKLTCSFAFSPESEPPRQNPDPTVYVHFGDGNASNTVRLVHKVSSLQLEKAVEGMAEPIRQASLRMAILLALKDEHRARLGVRLESFVDSSAGAIDNSTTGIWDDLVENVRQKCCVVYAEELPNIRRGLGSFLRDNYLSLFCSSTAAALRHGASRDDLLRALDKTIVATVLDE